MRRREARPFGAALDAFVGDRSPQTLLARVQRCWGGAVGPAIAAESEPVAEREGVVTVACSSSTWAHELSLLGPEIVDAINRSLGDQAGGAVKSLRTRIAASS